MFSYKKINIFLIFFLIFISGNSCDSVTEAEGETTEEPGTLVFNKFFLTKILNNFFLLKKKM